MAEEEDLLERLWKTDKVISKKTYDWLKPLYDEELSDLDEIRTAAAARKMDPFYQQDSDDDDDDDDDSDDDFLTTTTSTIELPGGVGKNNLWPVLMDELEGLDDFLDQTERKWKRDKLVQTMNDALRDSRLSSSSSLSEISSALQSHGNTEYDITIQRPCSKAVVRFVADANSSGHGNKVWHASIATCMYLRMRAMYNLLRPPSPPSSSSSSSSPWVGRSLELGAGTAVPSLYLARLLEQKCLFNRAARLFKKHHDQQEQELEQQQEGVESDEKTFVLRITDARQYRNIMQILRSVDIQEQEPLRISNAPSAYVQLEVHPHNWGDTTDDLAFCVDDDGDGDGGDSAPTPAGVEHQQQNDLVIVSDCIYNPEYHDVLLNSIAKTLALPKPPSSVPKNPPSRYTGGFAVVSFSLHGNVEDDAIWRFLEEKLPSTTRTTDNDDGTKATWRLRARCFSVQDAEFFHITNQNTTTDDAAVCREGWNMESTMERIGIVTEGLAPERWLAYVYEITWAEC